MLRSRQLFRMTTSRWNSSCCTSVALLGNTFTATGVTPSLMALYTCGRGGDIRQPSTYDKKTDATYQNITSFGHDVIFSDESCGRRTGVRKQSERVAHAETAENPCGWTGIWLEPFPCLGFYNANRLKGRI